MMMLYNLMDIKLHNTISLMWYLQKLYNLMDNLKHIYLVKQNNILNYIINMNYIQSSIPNTPISKIYIIVQLNQQIIKLGNYFNNYSLINNNQRYKPNIRMFNFLYTIYINYYIYNIYFIHHMFLLDIRIYINQNKIFFHFHSHIKCIINN